MFYHKASFLSTASLLGKSAFSWLDPGVSVLFRFCVLKRGRTKAGLAFTHTIM